MELVQEARELGRWAAEEMGMPAVAQAPESTLRRLCLGQGADIWAYILQHVHSQRNVKKIRGNLLWYGHQDSPEVRRKLELETTVSRLRAEIQELDQSLELMEQENETQDVATEQSLQSIRDTQYRALLLRAQAGAVRRQHHGLRDPMKWLQNQLKHLQDIERKAKVDVTFGSLTSAALALEPVVLRDVRMSCTLRAQFLQNLLVPEAREGSSPPQALAPADSSQALPSLVHLIQEGWRAVGALVTQRGALLKERQVLTGHLQGLVEEVERHSMGPREKKALMLGLQGCGLRAELKALCSQSQELEDASGHQQLLLRELQAKQQRILHWRQRVGKTQEQIRLLIKGNSASKTRLGRSPGEVLALVQQKVIPTSEAVAPQSQELLHCLEEGARHLPHILLSTLLRHNPEGLKSLPTLLPSIHQLHPASPKGSSLIALSHTLGLRAGKGPELLLPKAASLHQDLWFLQDQQSLWCRDLLHMKTSLPQGPSTQELLQIQASQEKEQKESLGQALKRLENMLKQALERIPELQEVVGDWWEQPGQAALSEELCQGLSLSQWRLRWVQAQGALQQLCR
ncbi:HAUS augmin-like complex subunit 5 isoform X3 [Heterocephalus glaber]|uniref:HAUS augmin-like complex subunit 5 isoform X3 n=1 Tax=Heterocephalus glaber TaxID=10181 RepID=A0AAX6R2E7_HETGA|nr:HAUS augmin-like complex subunit 5 isoform X3 [Heterocephalus glaber]